MEDDNIQQNQKPGPTCTDYERDQRIEQVRKWLCECTSRMDIVRMGMDKWSVQPRAIDDYISKANIIMRTLTKLSAEESLAEQTLRHEYLLKEAYRDNDRRTITATLKQLDFLKGLGKTNMDVTSNGKTIGFNIIVKNEQEKNDLDNI